MATCLVIDDVEVTRYTTKELLADIGVEALTVGNFQEATDALRIEAYDVILLDWHVGKASGLDFLKELRTDMGVKTPVIVFSGVEDESKASEAVSAGASSFLSKPTTKEKLAQAFQHLGVQVSNSN